MRIRYAYEHSIECIEWMLFTFCLLISFFLCDSSDPSWFLCFNQFFFLCHAFIISTPQIILVDPFGLAFSTQIPFICFPFFHFAGVMISFLELIHFSVRMTLFRFVFFFRSTIIHLFKPMDSVVWLEYHY